MAVAEPGFRRLAVNQSTWVRIPPVTPIGSSVSGRPLVFEASCGRSIRSLPAIAGSFSGRTPGSDPGSGGSIPSPAAIFMRVWSKGSGHRSTEPKIEVRFLVPVPFLRPWSKGSGHTFPKGEIQVRFLVAGPGLRDGGRLVRHSAVYGVQAGSIPVRRAIGYEV